MMRGHILHFLTRNSHFGFAVQFLSANKPNQKCNFRQICTCLSGRTALRIQPTWRMLAGEGGCWLLAVGGHRLTGISIMFCDRKVLASLGRPSQAGPPFQADAQDSFRIALLSGRRHQIHGELGRDVLAERSEAKQRP